MGGPYAFDDAAVCLTRHGSVVVERVEVVRPTGGLRVAAFAFRPAQQGHIYNYVSDPHQRLADVGYRTDGRMVVDRKCRTGGRPTGPGEGSVLLGVEVVKPHDATATGGGFLISYRSGWRRLTMYVPLGIILCSGTISEHPECDSDTLRPP